VSGQEAEEPAEEIEQLPQVQQIVDIVKDRQALEDQVKNTQTNQSEVEARLKALLKKMDETPVEK